MLFNQEPLSESLTFTCTEKGQVIYYQSVSSFKAFLLLVVFQSVQRAQSIKPPG